MTTVSDIVARLESFAPSSLAEDWDNVGLLWGDQAASIDRIMTCLTVTPTTVEEAVSESVGLIVSHHPAPFRPLQRLISRPDDSQGRSLWALARAGIAVASPHTAFDNAVGGINDLLAERLGLVEVGPLRPARPVGDFKLVVFTPDHDREAVLNAAFSAGAGRIGDYRECSFRTEGTGTFFGEVGTEPTIGSPGRRESVTEWRIEIITPAARLDSVLAAIRAAHSYEEPAIDAYPLRPVPAGPGVGRVGKLPEPVTLEAFARNTSVLLDAPGTAYVGTSKRPIERVAICCGAGDDFVPDAARGADVLLTGEARYHRAVEAESLGLGLVLAGHHTTERPGVEALAARLSAAFPELRVHAARTERDPIRIIAN